LALSLAGAQALVGCVFEPIIMPESRPAHDGGTPHPDAGHESVGDAEPEAHDDGGARAVAPDAGGPIRHRSCIATLPEQLPEEPSVSVSATGRPWFDTYRDIACDDLTDYPTCESDTDCPGSTCVHRAGQPGVCHSTWRQTSPLMLSFDDGRCITTVPFEAQARACCARLEGFECRMWPYHQDGLPGQACSRHGDCQPGLVCQQASSLSETPVYGLGVCRCPEVSRDVGLTEC
jgi:hypothetical protein